MVDDESVVSEVGSRNEGQGVQLHFPVTGCDCPVRGQAIGDPDEDGTCGGSAGGADHGTAWRGVLREEGHRAGSDPVGEVDGPGNRGDGQARTGKQHRQNN